MTKRRSLIIFILFAVLTAIGATAWTLLCEKESDDMYYLCLGSTGDSFWGAQEDDIVDYGDAFHAATAHYTHSNGRLANTLHILFQPLPKAIEDVFLGAMIALMFVLTILCSERDNRRRGVAAMLAAVLIWIALPWNDNFQSQDFKINYVLPSIAIMALLWLWPRVSTMSRRAYAGVVVLALSAGWFHEAFGIVAGAYALTMTLWQNRSRRYIIIVAAIGVGTLINMLLGTLLRMSNHVTNFGTALLRSLAMSYLTDLWPLWLAIALLIGACLMRPANRKQLLRLYLPMLIAACAGLPAALLSCIPHRSLWPALIFTFPILIAAGSAVLSRLPSRVLTVVCSVALIAYGWWLTELCRWESRIASEMQGIERLLAPREHKSISLYHFNFTPDDEIPSYLFGVAYQPLQKVYSKRSLFSYYNRGLRMFALADESTRGLAPSQWPAIPGNSNLRGVWPSIFAEDSVLRHYRFYFGPPTSNMPPVDRLLSLIKYGSADTVSHIPVYWLAGVTTHEGDTIYSLSNIVMPRTLRHRPLLRIDTVETAQ